MIPVQPRIIAMNRLVTIVFVGTVAMCLAAALFSFRRVALIDPALVFRG